MKRDEDLLRSIANGIEGKAMPPFGSVLSPAERRDALAFIREAAGHLVVAWLWLEQALATGRADSNFHEGKRQAARFFWRWELPRVHHRFDLLESLDRTVLDTPERWL